MPNPRRDLLVKDQVNLIGVVCGRHGNFIFSFSKIEQTGPIIEAAPFAPALDGGRLKPVQDVRRQKHMTAGSVQVEHGFHAGGRGQADNRGCRSCRLGIGQRGMTFDGGGVAPQNSVMAVAAHIPGRAIVKIPQSDQPFFRAGERFEHVLPNLSFRAGAVPNANLIQLTIQKTVG